MKFCEKFGSLAQIALTLQCQIKHDSKSIPQGLG